MIIGFDGSRAFTSNRTGTENYSYQLLKALSKIDKRNKYVIYLRPNVCGEALRNWPQNFQFKTINWPRLWTQGGLGLQTFKDDLDVLFVPAHTLPIIRNPRLKTIVTVHDLGSEYLPSAHQVKQRLYLGFMQQFQLKTATKIIAVSEATKKDLISRAGINSEKVKIVYEGYDKEKFKMFASANFASKNQSLKFKINQTINKYNLIYQNYFLFVGTVQPRKNLERLILAFDKFINHKSIKLVIVGSKGWLSDEIYELPKRLEIEDKVKFLGYVPDEELPSLYSGAIAFLFPSLFEGFGLPILEAQACGCPVITSNISSMPEVGGKGAIYVNPYSLDDIVEGMEKVQSSKFKVQMVKAGFENVKKFSWEKCAWQTLKVLENI